MIAMRSYDGEDSIRIIANLMQVQDSISMILDIMSRSKQIPQLFL